MNKFRFTIRLVVVATFLLAFTSIAQAQATRTWVSGVGDDVNPCSRTAPCKTYAGAISKTAVNGEISTLDPGGFGAVTITKSITIEGTQGQGYGSILHSGTTGISIPFDNFTAAGEGQKTVRLRNLNINGSGGSSGNAGSGFRGIRITGGVAATGTEVYVENCVIDGSFNAPASGIEDVRAGGGLLAVDGTRIRNMGSNGIVVNPSTGNTGISVIVSNSNITNTNFGMAVTKAAKVTVYNTVIASCSTVGLHVDNPGAGTTEMAVDHCVISNNTKGFEATTANSTIRVSNTTAMNNGTLFTAAGGGTVLSYGNNQTGGGAFGGGVAPS